MLVNPSLKPTPPPTAQVSNEDPEQPRKVLQPIKQQNKQASATSKYSADFDLISTFGPDTDPNQFSAAQVFQSFSSKGNELSKQFF